MRSWTKRLPARFAFELAEFESRGLDFAPDRRELDHNDRLVIRGAIEIDGTRVELEVVYPDTFPYFRPEVFAIDLSLGRHQNPYEHNLCLLDRSTRAWNTTDTGAWLVAERVPYLLAKLNEGGESLREAEVPQGEPITSYVLSEPGTAVFVPEELLSLPADVESGRIELRVGRQEVFQPRLRAGLVRVTIKSNGKKRTLGAIGDPLAERFSGATIEGNWVRLADLPEGRDAEALLAACATVDQTVLAPRWQTISLGQMAVTGLLTREETGQGEFGDAWLFVVRLRQRGPRGWQERGYVVRGDRLTQKDLASRIPDLAGMRNKTIAQVGLGALGAPVAIELARAQTGALRLVDHDVVESSTTVRWPYGLSAVGFPKVEFLGNVIARDYPFTTVTVARGRLGAAVRERQEGPDELTFLSAALEGADLIVDTAAEIGVSQLLADLARESDAPLLTMWGTEGGWGGAVAAILPGTSGCWYCLQLGLEDGTIQPPPADRGTSVQPRGCAEPTFTGTSFDLLEVVGAGLRMVRRLLLGGQTTSTVQVCAMRNQDGEELPSPRWDTYVLQVHPKCPVCHSAVAA